MRSRVNAALCLVLGGAGLLVMAYEGYLVRVDIPFALFATVVIGGATWSAATLLTTRRLLTLFVVAGMLGMVTQAMGGSLGAWGYPGPTHWFVGFAFGIGSIFNIGVVHLLARGLLHAEPVVRRVPPLVVIGLGGVIAASVAGDPRLETTFVAYYVVLVSIAFVVAGRTTWSTFATIVVVGASYGLIAEILGARCGLWLFDARWPSLGDNGPPLWLVLAGWPLETLTLFGASALLSREPLVPRIDQPR